MDYKLQNIVGNLLAAQGWFEIMSNSLTNAKYNALSEQLKEDYNVQMLNPLSQDLGVMRQSMLFSGLEALSHNINRRQSNLKFFEFGKTYHDYNTSREEHKHLSLFVTGFKNEESWTNAPQEKTNFFYLKGSITSILTRLGISRFQESETKNDVFSEGLQLSIGRDTLVNFGVLKSKIAKHFDINQEVFYADFNWDTIIEVAKRNKIKFTPIPKYPEVRRDFALLLNNDVTFESITKIAKKTEKQLLKDINLFDVYQGKNLPNGKKSYAVSFTFLDENKTLTDKVVDKVMNKLQNNFERELGAELR